MKFAIFGLAVTSSWGNGHATLWRGLGRALSARGHRVVFFERDQPFYAVERDLPEPPGIQVVLYTRWDEVRGRAQAELRDADVGMVTSFCPDGPAASAEVLASTARLRCFYDLDTPVTLAALERQQEVPYLPAQGLQGFDLALSYTGGAALEALVNKLGARCAAPLYGSVDPDVHRPVAPRHDLLADLTYLGTYSADRQPALIELLLEPARRCHEHRFIVAGAQYPESLDWPANVLFMGHLPPSEHSTFFASAPLTLNVTRAPMAALGYCPSARFFEAAASGVPVLSDVWEGIELFFKPGEEVLVARTAADSIAALELGPARLHEIGLRARERALAEHTAAARAQHLEALLQAATQPERNQWLVTRKELPCSA